MVWAKTKMQRMPESCDKCYFAQHHRGEEGWFCVILSRLQLGEMIGGKRKFTRPACCPLRDEKED